MKRVKKTMCLLLTALLLLPMLSGCGRKTEQEEKFVLKVCVCGDVASLDPAMNTDSEAQNVFYSLFENLMRCTGDGSGGAVVSPGVAKEYTETPEFDGGVTYHFTLRSSARWSDGKKVTANDFVYAWRRLVDPATESPNHAALSMVKGYDEVRETGDVSKLAVFARNDTTFEVTLSGPCSYFIEGVCTEVATMPLREDMITAYPDQWASSASLITNGAYRIGTWTQGEHLQTKRNGEYYESKLVGPDAIRFCFAADKQAAYKLYEDGEVDCVSYLPENLIAELAQSSEFRAVPLGETYCVLYNNYTDVFSDLNVRTAFDLSIDRAAIAGVAGAAAKAATGLIPYGILNGTAGEDFRTAGRELCAVDAEGYEERCREAMDCMNAAGYYRGAAFPALEYLYDESDAAAGAVAIELSRTWKEQIGVTIVPVALPAQELAERLASGEYNIAGACLRAGYNDAMSFLERFAGKNPGNASRYSNETYDILMGVADGSDNLTARTAFLHDAEIMLLEDKALSPLYFGGICGLLRESLYGLYFDSVGRCYFTDVMQQSS